MIEEKLKKVFDIRPNGLELSTCEMGFGRLENLESMQLGFRDDGEGNQIDDWFGDGYYIVGFDSMLGDPLIVNIDEKGIPVYFMMHDDWDSLTKIANSIEDFAEILKLIEQTNLKYDKEVKKLLKRINKLAPKKCYYWESLIETENEALNEE